MSRGLQTADKRPMADLWYGAACCTPDSLHCLLVHVLGRVGAANKSFVLAGLLSRGGNQGEGAGHAGTDR